MNKIAIYRALTTISLAPVVADAHGFGGFGHAGRSGLFGLLLVIVAVAVIATVIASASHHDRRN